MATKAAKAKAPAHADVKTEHGIKSHADHQADLAKAEKAEKDERAARVAKGLANIYHVDYLVRTNPETPKKKGAAQPSEFATPAAVRSGSVRLAAVSDDAVGAALRGSVEVGKNETLEVAAVRTLVLDVRVVFGAKR